MLHRVTVWALALALVALLYFPAAVAAKSKRRSRRQPAKQTQPAPERIREIQERLIETGYLSGEPGAKWDAATEQAMRGFQQANGFAVTGKPDALSLIKLGLGPKTAGVGAPVAPANGNAPAVAAENGNGNPRP